MNQANGNVARGCRRREASVCELGRVLGAFTVEVASDLAPEGAVECLQAGREVGDWRGPVRRRGRPGALRGARGMWVRLTGGEGCGGLVFVAVEALMVSEQ